MFCEYCQASKLLSDLSLEAQLLCKCISLKSLSIQELSKSMASECDIAFEWYCSQALNIGPCLLFT